MSRVVTFKLDDRTLEELDKLANEMGMPRSWLIREAIYRFLTQYGSGTSIVKRRIGVRRVIIW